MKQQDIYFPNFLGGNVGEWNRRCRQNARKLYPRNTGQDNGPMNWETLRRETLFNDLRFTNDKGN